MAACSNGIGKFKQNVANGVYGYAICSCGKEAAFLNPELNRVEPHSHYNRSDPEDFLKCRFCGHVYRNKAGYKKHLATEHSLNIFFVDKKDGKNGTNNTQNPVENVTFDDDDDGKSEMINFYLCTSVYMNLSKLLFAIYLTM